MVEPGGGASDEPTMHAAPPRVLDAVQVGDVLKERFVIEELLGAGGMGKVFRALDLRKQEASDRNPYVAVKVLKESLREHPASIIAMQREARKAQELSHPNILKVYDFDRDGNRFFITMEYLTGKSLDRIIRADDFVPMSQADAAMIIGAVGSALSFAHANGFMHWDLKPGNIFITDSGRVKVIDFGLARAIKRKMPSGEEATNLDATNFDIGSLGAMTPAYASPEMIESQTADPRGDVFSLACITYELLTGRHPFSRVPATHARDHGIKPARVATLKASQWQALERGLAFDPERRTPSVDAFLVELALARVTLSRTSRLRMPVAAGVVSALVGAALWLMLPGGGEGPETKTADARQAAPAVPEAPPPAREVPGREVAGREVPGVEAARPLLGTWCSSAFRLVLSPARGTFVLPNGAESHFTIDRYEFANGRLLVHGVGPDGLRTVTDFGGFSPDHTTMVQLRAQAAGDTGWREYNRTFQRC